MNTVSEASRPLAGAGTPLLYTTGAVVIGLALPRFEAAFLPGRTVEVGAGPAIAALSAIANR